MYIEHVYTSLIVVKTMTFVEKQWFPNFMGPYITLAADTALNNRMQRWTCNVQGKSIGPNSSRTFDLWCVSRDWT